MDSIDKICTVIPKLKNQLVFLKEREKLFDQAVVNRDNDKENDAPFINVSEISPPSAKPSSFRSSSEILFNLPQRRPLIEEQFLNQTTTHGDVSLIPKGPDDENLRVPFPFEYVVPSLPASLVKDIETGAIQKFGPHHSNRQILIDIVSHDLVDKYNLW